MLQQKALEFLHARPRLFRLAQAMRFIAMRGPMRGPAVRFYQTRKPRASIALGRPGILPQLDVRAKVAELERDGCSSVFRIPAKLVESLCSFQQLSRSDDIHHPHRKCEAFETIARDPSVIDVVRGYLGTEPVLYASRLYQTSGRIDERGGFIDPANAAAKIVHFDSADFKDVCLFVYLTDVDAESNAHVVYQGTHRHKTWSELLRRKFTVDEASRRFGGRERMITGCAGTAFFEDTAAFHMISMGRTARSMASVTYTIHRSPSLARYL